MKHFQYFHPLRSHPFHRQPPHLLCYYWPLLMCLSLLLLLLWRLYFRPVNYFHPDSNWPLHYNHWNCVNSVLPCCLIHDVSGPNSMRERTLFRSPRDDHDILYSDDVSNCCAHLSHNRIIYCKNSVAVDHIHSSDDILSYSSIYSCDDNYDKPTAFRYRHYKSYPANVPETPYAFVDFELRCDSVCPWTTLIENHWNCYCCPIPNRMLSSLSTTCSV